MIKQKKICMLIILSMLCFHYEMFSQQQAEPTVNGFTHEIKPEELMKQTLKMTGEKAATGLPASPARNIAEFEPMEGVLIAYPEQFALPYSLIAEMSKDTIVTTLVANQNQETKVRSQYISNGVNLANCTFIQTPINTYWTRDYGPWYIADGNHKVAIIDPFYSNLRPNDDAVPEKVSQTLGIDSYFMDYAIQGGNYMTDGRGIAVSTDLVFDENPGRTETQIKQIVSSYLNISTYYITKDPNQTYIDHIDCWGKFLGVDKILIREVPASNSQYNKIEELVDFFEQTVSSYATPYRIYRINTANDEPYTNSLILNNKVLIPLTGSANDNAAIASYSAAMPGYQVIGFASSQNDWLSSDALHCRTIGMADRNMIYIDHMPLLGIQRARDEYTIEAEIISYAGEIIYQDDVKIHYSENSAPFVTSAMQLISGNTYRGTIIRTNGVEISYYLSAEDPRGRTYLQPYIGEPDPFQFTIDDEPPTATGDVNNDNTINIIDALITAQYYVGLDPPNFHADNADVNCSGKIDIVDALLIAQYYVGLVSSFPC